MNEFITKTTIIEVYGLTERELALLGEPDKIAPNPHYRRVGAPMRLYHRQRVMQFLDDHPDIAQKAQQRTVQRARRRAQREAESEARAQAWAEQIPIKTRKDAEANVQRFIAEGLTGSKLLARVRHEATTYESALRRLDELTGLEREFAYTILHERANALAQTLITNISPGAKQ